LSKVSFGQGEEHFPGEGYFVAAWLRLLALTGDLAVVEPKLLRFKMLHVPARRGTPRRGIQLASVFHDAF
jgi:hypothetical protein